VGCSSIGRGHRRAPGTPMVVASIRPMRMVHGSVCHEPAGKATIGSVEAKTMPGRRTPSACQKARGGRHVAHRRGGGAQRQPVQVEARH